MSLSNQTSRKWLGRIVIHALFVKHVHTCTSFNPCSNGSNGSNEVYPKGRHTVVASTDCCAATTEKLNSFSYINENKHCPFGEGSAQQPSIRKINYNRYSFSRNFINNNISNRPQTKSLIARNTFSDFNRLIKIYTLRLYSLYNLNKLVIEQHPLNIWEFTMRGTFRHNFPSACSHIVSLAAASAVAEPFASAIDLHNI